jgi:TnpA family transposase
VVTDEGGYGRFGALSRVIGVVQLQRAGKVPEAIITDTGSYSDIVFGLRHLIGIKYRPQLANLPDQRLWRFDDNADYGPLSQAARGRIDTAKIAARWEDMCRVAVSIHSCEVSAHDVTRMISRDGNPTPLGHAIAHYGRIFKTLHILRLADDEPYRREGKAQANLVEGRHDLARRIYHGKKGEMVRTYYEGMEDQLSSLGLVLNCTVLWTSRPGSLVCPPVGRKPFPGLGARSLTSHCSPAVGAAHCTLLSEASRLSGRPRYAVIGSRTSTAGT